MDNRPEEAKGYAEDVLAFYRQAGFRKELIQTLTVLSGVYEQLGEYQKGVAAGREALEGALQMKERVSEALARERLGANLMWLGLWPEALDEHRKAADLYVSASQGAETRLACVQLFARLGRREEAMQFLQDLQQQTAREQNPRVTALILARKAEMAYDDRQWKEASNLAAQGIAAENSNDRNSQDFSLLRTLAQIQANRRSDGVELATGIVQKLDAAKLAGKAAEARLMTAEALLATGERSRARQLLAEAVRFYESRQNFESLWRAHVLAARASEDPKEIAGHRMQAEAALSQVKMRWSEESMKGYMRRPAIRQLSAEARL
jgi:tetratricopeptide (TPR) repeat protein